MSKISCSHKNVRHHSVFIFTCTRSFKQKPQTGKVIVKAFYPGHLQVPSKFAFTPQTLTVAWLFAFVKDIRGQGYQ